ncbi:Aldo/keto reductase [Atractiella rhizophila]|nr:Aldo/keto reductase [Atractiella rhizophila]
MTNTHQSDNNSGGKCPLEVIIGSGTFGQGPESFFHTVSSLESLLSYPASKGYRSIDAAWLYPPEASGTCEELLGEYQAAQKGWKVDTKIMSFRPNAHSDKLLRESIEDSLRRLRVGSVRTLFLHWPEPGKTTPIRDILRTIDDLYREGKFEKFGLSNFTAEDVEEFMQVSKEEGWIPVSVYQGQYNALARKCETGLFPTLRKHNISFTAYSPTAGGFLTGKWLRDADSQKGRRPVIRFDPASTNGAISRSWYMKPTIMNSLSAFLSFLQTNYPSLHPIDVGLRWVAHHSSLCSEKGDAIIVGGNSEARVWDNVNSLEKGPLPEAVVERLETMWKEIEKDAMPYHGGVETVDYKLPA